MSNFNNLVEKILNEAKNKKQDVLNKANEENARIVDDKVKQAEKQKDRLIENAHIQGKENKERMISKCELKIRNEKLKAKQRVLNEIFNESLEILSNIDKKSLIEYIKNSLETVNLNGTYELIVQPKNEDIVKDSLDELNEFMANAKISSVKVKDDLKGGFILGQNDIYMNFSFESKINIIREELENEISNLLFNS